MAGTLGLKGQSKYGPAKSLSHINAPQYQLCIILLQQNTCSCTYVHCLPLCNCPLSRRKSRSWAQKSSLKQVSASCWFGTEAADAHCQVHFLWLCWRWLCSVVGHRSGSLQLHLLKHHISVPRSQANKKSKCTQRMFSCTTRDILHTLYD